MGEGNPPPVVNSELLVAAMGYWPSFHDAHVLSASLDGERCEVVLYVFRMADEVDERGYFVVTDHHRVCLAMHGVSTCSLPDGYQPDILFELVVECSDEQVTVTFDSVMGQDWRAICQQVILTDVVPCGPDGKSII